MTAIDASAPDHVTCPDSIECGGDSRRGCVPGGCYRVLHYFPSTPWFPGSWPAEVRLSHGHRWLEGQYDREVTEAARLHAQAEATRLRMVLLRREAREAGVDVDRVLYEDETARPEQAT